MRHHLVRYRIYSLRSLYLRANVKHSILYDTLRIVRAIGNVLERAFGTGVTF